jgi:uncharacterized membrane protein YtjA (UPF0391 family)
MMNWAWTFLVIALIAALLGSAGFAGEVMPIAWPLFIVFFVIFALSLPTGRRLAV